MGAQCVLQFFLLQNFVWPILVFLFHVVAGIISSRTLLRVCVESCWVYRQIWEEQQYANSRTPYSFSGGETSLESQCIT